MQCLAADICTTYIQADWTLNYHRTDLTAMAWTLDIVRGHHELRLAVLLFSPENALSGSTLNESWEPDYLLHTPRHFK